MHEELYDLKDKLCRELSEYGKKEKIDASTLQVIDTLSHSLKNVCKIIECYEAEENGYSAAQGGYSNFNMPRVSYAGGNSYEGGNSYGGGMSYARGRGSNARRDSMGRYSSRDGGYSNGGDFRMEMQELIKDAPNEFVRQKMMEAMNGM